MIHLQLRDASVGVDASLAELASRRANLAPFRAQGAAGAVTRVVRALADPRWRVLDERLPHLGTYAVESGEVRVHCEDDPLAAEAAIRAGFAVAAARAGGLLLHGAAFHAGGAAILAVGRSGAGKTTLTQLAVGAGARALSDENVVWYPDGTVQGTPFRSDPAVETTADVAPLAMTLSLRKADAELLAPADAHSVAALALAQAYWVPKEILAPSEYLARAARLAQSARACELSFRKHPDAGAFVVGWLRAHPGGSAR